MDDPTVVLVLGIGILCVIALIVWAWMDLTEQPKEPPKWTVTVLLPQNWTPPARQLEEPTESKFGMEGWRELK